ncbi:hypothetical protein F2Q69_00047618 [Brassica cretica]|uniref:Uncharacterized protein n=1 Tax=Brassica cretica TaxID=69181 RepID=A0A8S9Q3B0_BRACR|nr:hypothetical protein F2Q69_00047618 [Brassica cretica]
MPPPPARKEIVLELSAPSVVPVAQPKGRKRKFTKGGDGESSQQGNSSIASGLRGKVCRSLTLLIVTYFSERQRIPNFLLVSQFMSLIDGMISECGSETSRLAGELLELQGRWSETESMLTAVKDSHSVKVLKLEVAIGELERDLGKTASSLLKEKKTRKAKSSEVRRLQRQIEGDAGLASRGIREAKDSLRSEFQARLAKISAFLGSLECIWNMDLTLATIEGGIAVVQSFQSETPPTLEAEEARLSGVGTEIRTVDFLLNKETRKTLISQTTRISANYHTSSNQNTRITTIRIRNRKREQSRSYSESAYERLQQGISLGSRAVGEIPSSSNPKTAKPN